MTIEGHAESLLTQLTGAMSAGGGMRHVLVAVLVVLALVRGATRGRRRLPPGKKPAKRRESALRSIWNLLCPSLTRFDLANGGWQIYAILLLSLARIYLMNQASRIVQRLDFNAMTRDQTEFWAGWRQQLKLSVVSCVHRQTYKYVETSLAVAWRKKLTRVIHEKYFHGKNYYLLAQQSAQGETESERETKNKGPSVDDPDERISEDAKEVATQLAHVFCEGIYASTAGTFFALKLGQLYGAHYALAPYLYLWGMFALRNAVSPIKMGKWLLSTRELFAKYKTGHQLLVTNSEAVAALDGGRFEEVTLRARFDAAVKKARAFHRVVVWPNLTEQLAYTWLIRSFMATFVVGPHLYLQKVKPDLTTVANIAKLRGDIGHQFVLFVESMIAAGATAKMLNQLTRIAGPATRVHQLLSALDNDVSEIEGDVIVAGDRIAFDHVDVRTPDGSLLVRDLSFAIEKGTSLLLTGHNGAGKSSIFRCLGGLWNTTVGSIVKPGGKAGDGLHQQGGVYYLPQKPYNVRGTLKEQMAYPDSGSAITDEGMREVLNRVDLSHLAGAYDTDAVVNWGEVLSLGEMQRLAIARLLYHEPAFAILDECTSAVSGEMERQLYEVVLKEAKTAYITISHRPVLKAYHDQLLTIGEPNAGYTLETLDRASYARETSRAKHRLQAKSTLASSKAVAPAAPAESKASFASFCELVRIGLPTGKAKKLSIVALALVAHVGIKVRSTAILGEMMSAIFAQDASAFTRMVAASVGYACAGATVEQAMQYMEHDLAESMMEGLTKSFLSRYLTDNAFYKLVQLDCRVTDPQQRLTTDLRNFTNNTAALIPQFAKPLAELFWFSYSIQRMVGTKAVAFFGAYLLVGSSLIRAAMPEFRKIVAKESALEGMFKAAHSRVRHHAESIAFYGGGSREKRIVNTKFDELMTHAQDRLLVTWKFNLINGGIVREAPNLVQWLLRNEYSKGMADADVIRDGGEHLGRVQAFIFDATNQMFICMGQLLNLAEHLENLGGLTSRVHELHSVLDQVNSAQPNPGAECIVTDNVLGLQDVTIATPTGKTLATHVNVEVKEGRSLMVTGPNAVGKTSFFRVIGGLWPAAAGRVLRPAGKQLFLVPQQVFMVAGTFSDQITYPQRVTGADVGAFEQMLSLVRLVGVDYLAKRHSWDEERQWEHILSLGEQQRIGMARLFFHR
eukprot:gene8489-13107_t